jgi:hypothetical protein
VSPRGMSAFFRLQKPFDSDVYRDVCVTKINQTDVNQND